MRQGCAACIGAGDDHYTETQTTEDTVVSIKTKMINMDNYFLIRYFNLYL